MSALCLACGLCCDGSLFGFVPLEPAEIAPARARGLAVIASGRGFEQPCPALRGGCTLYAERPAACRRFTCRLLARDGPVSAVHRVRALMAQLRALGHGPGDFVAGDAVSPVARALYDELMLRLERDFARADQAQ